MKSGEGGPPVRKAHTGCESLSVTAYPTRGVTEGCEDHSRHSRDVTKQGVAHARDPRERGVAMWCECEWLWYGGQDTSGRCEIVPLMCGGGQCAGTSCSQCRCVQVCEGGVYVGGSV